MQDMNQLLRLWGNKSRLPAVCKEMLAAGLVSKWFVNQMSPIIKSYRQAVQ